MAAHEGDVLEYAWDHPKVRADRERPALLHRVADDERHRQRSRALLGDLRRQHAREEDRLLAGLLAKAVFADPELTVDLPRA
jgi:hypothetical protein